MELREIRNALKKKAEERKKEKELEKKEDMKERDNLRKEKELENRKIDLKLKLLDSILKWAKEFSSTEDFKKILKHNGDDSIIVFYSRWAHIGARNNDIGGWARVYLYKNGKLEYRDGYKWMGFRKSFYFNKNIINNVMYSYLKELNDAIISKKIYKTIKEEIED